VAARFLRCAIEGIEYARANPEAAADIVMRFAPQEEREHQLFLLTTELEASRSAVTQENGTGWQTAQQWRALYDTLVEYGAIEGGTPFPEGVFTNDVLDAAKAP
jgi:ABC-type nitrate/sulfonate/bicarbonate transport system substrate-binding protein